MPISLEIVTPSETIYSEEVDHVVIPTSSGKIDVLPNHVPVLDKLIAGDIKVEKDGITEYLAVGSGFVGVYAEKVSLLTDQAINVNNTEESEIEEAIQRAEKALTDAKSSNIDQAKIDKLEAAARFAFAQKLAKGKSKQLWKLSSHPEGVVGPAGYVEDVILAIHVLNSIITNSDSAIVEKHWAGDRDILELVKEILEIADSIVGKKN